MSAPEFFVGIDVATGEDGGAVVWRDRSDSAGLFLDLHAKRARARRGHGGPPMGEVQGASQRHRLLVRAPVLATEASLPIGSHYV
jgi:hypothetical protein